MQGYEGWNGWNLGFVWCHGIYPSVPQEEAIQDSQPEIIEDEMPLENTSNPHQLAAQNQPQQSQPNEE